MKITAKSFDKTLVKRRVVLAIITLITFSLQTTGHAFPAPFGIHAMLLIPLIISIAMFEREFVGVFFGLAAGAALDAFSSQSVCFSAISYTVIGITAGALITYLMRNNMMCAVILTAIFTFLYNSFYFIFFYAFKENNISFSVYLHYYFLSVIYTTILSPIFYMIVRTVYKKFK